MSQTTQISWCDSTLNFWSGCTKVSEGCAHCYAETMSNRFATKFDHIKGQLAPAFGSWGKGAPRQLHESAFKEAFRLNRKPWVCDCGRCGQDRGPGRDNRPCMGCGAQPHRRRIFSLSLGDWLDPEVPIEWLARMLDTIRQCDQVEWILCTKRPELWRERMDAVLHWQTATGEGRQEVAFFEWVEAWTDCVDMPERGDVPQNITLLTSVENQKAADTRIPELLKIPAACRGLSLEPLLGPVDVMPWIGKIDAKECGLDDDPMAACFLQQAMDEGRASAPCERALDWLIIGGESGNNARPCNVDWIRDLVRQGKAAGVAVHVKQLGANPIMEPGPVTWPCEHPKGGDPNEWPEDLRVQEFPR